jgi:hypothetical protein
MIERIKKKLAWHKQAVEDLSGMDHHPFNRIQWGLTKEEHNAVIGALEGLLFDESHYPSKSCINRYTATEPLSLSEVEVLREVIRIKGEEDRDNLDTYFPVV